MTDKEANDQRLIAAQIIWNLWDAGQAGQLRQLEAQAKSSLAMPKKKEKKRA